MHSLAIDDSAAEMPLRVGRYLFPIAGIWFLYIVGYSAFRYAGGGLALGLFNTGVQTALDLTACAVATVFATRIGSWNGKRILLALLAAASLGLAITNFFWGVLFNILGDMHPGGYQDLSFRIPFLITVICWLVFWGLILFRDDSVALSLQGFAVIGAVSLVAVAVFIISYLPLLSVETPSYIHVFVLVYASVELVALILCIAAAALNTRNYPALIGAGFILFVASDFILNSAELTGQLSPNEWVEIPWVLGEVCVLIGIFAFARRGEEGRRQPQQDYGHNMMSILLFAGLFASAMLVAFTLSDGLEVRVFATVILVGFTVIVVNRFANLYAEAVRAAVGPQALFPPAGATVPHQGALRAFGSFNTLQTIRDGLQAMVKTTVRVGSGFTFRTADTWSAPRPRSIFVVMPYRRDWSDGVYSAVAAGADDAGWSVNRADERFSEQDLLLNIWVEMCRSEIVVADITAHTPNVLYEIGIAHTIGKPVVLLLQEGGSIPFDLCVQRTIFYDTAAPEWPQALGRSICRLLRALDQERDYSGAAQHAE